VELTTFSFGVCDPVSSRVAGVTFDTALGETDAFRRARPFTIRGTRSWDIERRGHQVENTGVAGSGACRGWAAGVFD
jgi:hypothetical protein